MNEILANIGESGGWTVAIVGYSIVFSALVLLILIFSAIPKLINLKLKSRNEIKIKRNRLTKIFMI